MPNPFPGMNPYMEAAHGWPSVHNTLSVYLADALSEVLPSRYAAQVDEHCRVVQTQRNFYPDVLVNRNPASGLLNPASGGVAVASPPAVFAPIAADTPVIVSLLPVEPPETYINIVDTGQGERVVAMIEILSPVNKALGEGRNSYLVKQDEVLHSQTHLIEIDLLRAGTATVAVGHPFMPDVGRYEYSVCLHRAGQAQFEVWPCSIRQRLPRIAVPLASGDADVTLDLQAAIDRCYERRGFAQRIDYTQPPELPLTEEDAAWADALLRAKGLRF